MMIRRPNDDPHRYTHTDFWLAWRRLSVLGACDAHGGMEFRRVYSAWLVAGRVDEPEAFIRREANIGPLGP